MNFRMRFRTLLSARRGFRELASCPAQPTSRPNSPQIYRGAVREVASDVLVLVRGGRRRGSRPRRLLHGGRGGGGGGGGEGGGGQQAAQAAEAGRPDAV